MTERTHATIGDALIYMTKALLGIAALAAVSLLAVLGYWAWSDVPRQSENPFAAEFARRELVERQAQLTACQRTVELLAPCPTSEPCHPSDRDWRGVEPPEGLVLTWQPPDPPD
jgi:hypothetical protein